MTESTAPFSREVNKAVIDKLREQIKRKNLRRAEGDINGLLYFKPKTSSSSEESSSSSFSSSSSSPRIYPLTSTMSISTFNPDNNSKLYRSSSEQEEWEQEEEEEEQYKQSKKVARNYNALHPDKYITADALREQLNSLEHQLRYTIDGIEVSELRSPVQRALSARRITRAQLEEIIASRKAHERSALQLAHEGAPKQITNNYLNEGEFYHFSSNGENDSLSLQKELEELLYRYVAALRSLSALKSHHATSTSSTSSSSPSLTRSTSNLFRLPYSSWHSLLPSSSLSSSSSSLSSSSSSPRESRSTQLTSQLSTHQFYNTKPDNIEQKDKEPFTMKKEVFAIEIEIPALPSFAIQHDIPLRKRVAKNSICAKSRIRVSNFNSFVDFGPLTITNVAPQFVFTPHKVKQCEMEGAMPPITIRVIGDRFTTELMRESYQESMIRLIELHEMIAKVHEGKQSTSTFASERVIKNWHKRKLSYEIQDEWMRVEKDNLSENNSIGLISCIPLFEEQLQMLSNSTSHKELTLLLGNCPFLQMLAPEEYNNPSLSNEVELMERLRTPRFLSITLPREILEHTKQKQHYQQQQRQHQEFEEEEEHSEKEFTFMVQVNPTLARLYLPNTASWREASFERSEFQKKRSLGNSKREKFNVNEMTGEIRANKLNGDNSYIVNNREELTHETLKENVFHGNHKRPLLICEGELKNNGILLGVQLVGDTWTEGVGEGTKANVQTTIDSHSRYRFNRDNALKSMNTLTEFYETAQDVALINSFSAASHLSYVSINSLSFPSSLLEDSTLPSLHVNENDAHGRETMEIKFYDSRSDFVDYLYNVLFAQHYHNHYYEENEQEHHYNNHTNNNDNNHEKGTIEDDEHESQAHKIYSHKLIHKYNDSFISIFFPPITSSSAIEFTYNNNGAKRSAGFEHSHLAAEFSLLPSFRPFHKVEEITFAVPGITTQCQGCLLADSNLFVAGDLVGT